MSVKDKAAAIDRFVRTIKASGVYDDIGTACIMAGWTNLAGALTPLKGAAPTNVSGLFQDADLDPGIGLKGNGSSKYLNSNRANNADGQNDHHMACYATAPNTLAAGPLMGSGRNAFTGTDQITNATSLSPTDLIVFSRLSTTLTYDAVAGGINAVGLQGISRSESAGYKARVNGADTNITRASAPPVSDNTFVFDRNPQGAAASPTDATLSWYSIGSATDLAALDSAVSTLMADLRAIDEAGFDRDALAYIRNVEAADGSYLETGVKQAINAFVVGCKADGIWDALKASCIMCGARTISGALVPLAGTAPTAYSFASGDYDRSSGLKGDGSTKYLDSGRANDADGQNDFHIAVHETATHNNGSVFGASVSFADIPNASISQISYRASTASLVLRAKDYNSDTQTRATGVVGFTGVNRGSSSSFSFRFGGTGGSIEAFSAAATTANYLIFAQNNVGSTIGSFSNARLAFYSIGSSLDLAALDNRVSTLVSAIAAAI